MRDKYQVFRPRKVFHSVAEEAKAAAAAVVVVVTSHTHHCIASPTFRRPCGDLPYTTVYNTQEVVYHTPLEYATRVVNHFVSQINHPIYHRGTLYVTPLEYYQTV